MIRNVAPCVHIYSKCDRFVLVVFLSVFLIPIAGVETFLSSGRVAGYLWDLGSIFVGQRCFDAIFPCRCPADSEQVRTSLSLSTSLSLVSISFSLCVCVCVFSTSELNAWSSKRVDPSYRRVCSLHARLLSLPFHPFSVARLLSFWGFFLILVSCLLWLSAFLISSPSHSVLTLLSLLCRLMLFSLPPQELAITLSNLPETLVSTEDVHDVYEMAKRLDIFTPKLARQLLSAVTIVPYTQVLQWRSNPLVIFLWFSFVGCLSHVCSRLLCVSWSYPPRLFRTNS